MIGRAEIAGLIPHAFGMCLLDRVDQWDDRMIRCSSDSHRDPQHPLRNGPRLAALHLCEYGAQATAVHGGLLVRRASGGRAAPGLLASLREVELAVDRIDDIEESLSVSATQKIAGAGGWLYEFAVNAGERWLARGRVMVMHP